MWDEDFTPKPEDLPIPEGALQLKYDDFFGSIEFKHDDPPKKLFDFFTAKLDSQTWKKVDEDSLHERSATIKRTSGTASLVIYIGTEDGKTRVDLQTKGMSWDQIKLANANAKKAKEASPSSTASKSNVPTRPSKPNRGLEKLEKLPSLASVTIDGKKTSLTEIFAYELISYGTWRTHIVATAQPVKQAPLLALLQANIPEEKWEEQWRLPSPNVVLILDDDDSIRSVHLLADKVPGSSTAVKGEAIVEGGRARGKAVLKPQKFFEHSYEAEITFDTQLINTSTAPRKLLEHAPKLANAGKIVLAAKTFSLPYVTAYQVGDANKAVIQVVLTEKPLERAKILASLTQSGEVGISVIGFQTQISFTINQNDELSSMFLWCDGVSVNWSGNEKIQTSVQSEDGRVRGTSKTIAKEDVFGKPCEFEASFDTTILRANVPEQSK